MNWYALQVAPQKEASVVETLTKYDLPAFYPTFKMERWRRVPGTCRQKVLMVKTYASIPGYVFARCREPWTDIKRNAWARYVTGVLAVAGRPAIIPAHEIAHLPGAPVQASSDYVQPSFRPGQEVEIASGPYQGWLVPIETIEGDTAEVLMEMFGAKRRVKVKLGDLEAA